MSKQISVIKQKATGTDLENLVAMLSGMDGVIRLKARESLLEMGNPAVLSLTKVLQNSGLAQARWEAAKILGGIDDKRAIPSLVHALEDNNQDVAWLAAEALSKYRKVAWPLLLRMLIKRGSDSISLRDGVHHVLLNQKEDGFNDLLATLMEALELSTVQETATIAAYNILERLKIKNS